MISGIHKYSAKFLLLLLVLGLCLLLNVSMGSVTIPFEDTLSILFGGKAQQQTWIHIVMDYRLPKALTALMVGGGLAISGLLMQTFFRNPLAGPFVLGISSGAGLGAALLIMGSTLLGASLGNAGVNSISLAVASSLGSLLVLFVVMIVAQRVKDVMALLIIGLMFGSISSALVSVLAYFSDAEKIRQYLFWSYGSVGDLSMTQVGILFTIIILGVGLAVFSLKSLNALLLGERYAQTLGVNLKLSRILILLSTGILAGGITAFAGPIAFVGLAVPHLTRLVFNSSDHKVLLPAVFIYGGILVLLCDTLAQLPGNAYVLPLNAITSLVGAPVVIWLLIRKRKLVF